MKSWNRPEVPQLSAGRELPRLWDTASSRLVETRPQFASDPEDSPTAGIYVCGITPYDSTHIGHAATYLAYDTLIRLWLGAGVQVTYVQNTTDVDDPLLERAHATGVDWRDLAAEQTDRFRRDMEALAVIPPDHFVAVTDAIDHIAEAVVTLRDRDIAYLVGDDWYFDSTTAERVAPWHLGDESHYDRTRMLQLSAERGGDPDRPGKRDPLDPLLWRGAREGEPSWDTVLGTGRPGWHIECSVISADHLTLPITVKGGGSDLIFPHHEFSAGHTAALTGESLALLYSHAGLVGYRGEKMSKSLGNLVFVSDLVEGGTDPRAIRLAILSQHYRSDWEWTAQLLTDAEARLTTWTQWAATATPGESTLDTGLYSILSDDLDGPGALFFVDASCEAPTPPTTGDLNAIEALLGIRL